MFEKKFVGKKIYSPSPHILKNIQHIFKGGIRNPLSVLFFLDIIFKRKDVVVLVWGTKTNETLTWLLKKMVKVVHLEDGFYRSFGTGSQGYKTHSLVMDTIAPFYDATKANDLKRLINHAKKNLDEKTLAVAEEAINFIHKYKITKYNKNMHFEGDRNFDKNNVLIVDQTFGDHSLSKGLLPPEVDIELIISRIMKRNPDAKVFVKVHPETISGDKSSALKIEKNHKKLSAQNVNIVEKNYNPIELLEVMGEVHVLTSQVGFEALLLGKEVFVYGEPFYSKIGKTNNYKPSYNMTSLTPTELFAVFCIEYTFYFDKEGREIDVLTHLKNLQKEKMTLSPN